MQKVTKPHKRLSFIANVFCRENCDFAWELLPILQSHSYILRYNQKVNCATSDERWWLGKFCIPTKWSKSCLNPYKRIKNVETLYNKCFSICDSGQTLLCSTVSAIRCLWTRCAGVFRRPITATAVAGAVSLVGFSLGCALCNVHSSPIPCSVRPRSERMWHRKKRYDAEYNALIWCSSAHRNAQRHSYNVRRIHIRQAWRKRRAFTTSATNGMHASLAQAAQTENAQKQCEQRATRSKRVHTNILIYYMPCMVVVACCWCR